MRIPRHQMFMDMAHVAARRSTCVRLNVGALIVMNDRPISLGYNGAPAGEPHCAGNECPGRKPGGCPTIHAEVNALNFAAQVTRLVDVDLYVTHSPCSKCVEYLLGFDLAVQRVFFSTLYRDPQPLWELNAHGRGVYQVTHAGHLIEWRTGEMLEEPK